MCEINTSNVHGLVVFSCLPGCRYGPASFAAGTRESAVPSKSNALVSKHQLREMTLFQDESLQLTSCRPQAFFPRAIVSALWMAIMCPWCRSIAVRIIGCNTQVKATTYVLYGLHLAPELHREKDDYTPSRAIHTFQIRIRRAEYPRAPPHPSIH